ERQPSRQRLLQAAGIALAPLVAALLVSDVLLRLLCLGQLGRRAGLGGHARRAPLAGLTERYDLRVTHGATPPPSGGWSWPTPRAAAAPARAPRRSPRRPRPWCTAAGAPAPPAAGRCAPPA